MNYIMSPISEVELTLVEEIGNELSKMKEPGELWLNPIDKKMVNKEIGERLKSLSVTIRTTKDIEPGRYCLFEKGIVEQAKRIL